MTVYAMQKREQFLERPLPSSEDAERCIVGAVLIDERLIATVIEHIRPEDLYSPLYRRVYLAMINLFETKRSIDPINIVEELKKDGQVESIGGIAVITNLTYGLPMWTLANSDTIRDYCLTVKAKSRRRKLIHTCNQIVTSALDEGDADGDVLQNAQTAINAVCSADSKKHFRPIGELAVESVHKVVELRDGTRDAGGLQTGLTRLDFVTGGLQKSDFIVIAARPGMGKSALAGQIALNVCERNRGAVTAIFSLEMNEEQYTNRLLATRASIDLQRMRRGALNDDELARLTRAAVGFNELNFVIDDSSVISGAEMRSKLLKLKHERGRLDLIIVDYLQRMVTSKKVDNRQQEVSQIAQDLKSLAKDFDVPVVALASLNRGCEARNPPRPRMSDLRDSGDIESEADLVSFIYRPFQYDPSANPRLAELIIDKHRNGPTDTLQLGFMGEFTRFSDFD